MTTKSAVPFGQADALNAAIASYGVVGSAADDDLLTIARLAARICDVPTATVNLLDATEQHSVATFGFPKSSIPRAESFCDTTVRLDHQLHISNATLDARFSEHPHVTGELGSVRFYAGSQLRTTDGLTVGTLCVFDDVERELDSGQREALDDLATQVVQVLELRAMTALLSSSNAELSRSNADLSTFAARVAHDLRNPIAATTGFLALAQNAFGDQLTGRARECVEHASASVGRMAAQVDDLLAYAGLGARPQLREVDLAAVARDVVGDVRVLVSDTSGTVEVGPLPTVQTDPTLVRLLLLNVISNGLKYARPGVPPVVDVSGLQSAEGWRLVITDNGRGIPKDDRARVFDLFTRLRTTADVSGSGIGLATCARIAETLGGRIELGDAADGGTSVTFVVPTPTGTGTSA